MENKEMTAVNEIVLEKKTLAEEPAVSKDEAVVNKAPALEVFVQYREYEVNMETVIDRVKSHYCAKGNKEDSIESIQVYVKPEDFTAYYVINDSIAGKVSLF